MLDLMAEVAERARGRCALAEVRWVAREADLLAVRTGRVERAEHERSEGIGIRVRVDGAWGYAATRDVSLAGAERALERALVVAHSAPRPALAPAGGLEPGRLEEPPARGDWASPYERDPFAVALDERLALLFAAEQALRSDAHGGRLVRTEAVASAVRTRQALATTEGAACTQTRVECGGGLAAIASDGDEVQIRTFPAAHGGHVAQAGWEHVERLGLAEHAPRVAAEAVELLTAPPCPAGRTTVVLEPEQVALQLHESIGHALELDRILLGEAAYAGTSWVGPQDIGSLRYGSEHLTVVADATLPGGLGTFGWDDEGTAARRTTLIEHGVLRDVLSDRESAAAAGLERSSGCSRSQTFDRQPLVRMTNVSLAPGEGGSLDDLIAGVDEGLLLETNRSWSIDDRRLHFQFGTEVAREIRAGRLGRLLRNPSYAGITPRFWASLDAVGSEAAWQVNGVVNCGKGEPGQLAVVSHGAAPARFRDVEVGVA